MLTMNWDSDVSIVNQSSSKKRNRPRDSASSFQEPVIDLTLESTSDDESDVPLPSKLTPLGIMTRKDMSFSSSYSRPAKRLRIQTTPSDSSTSVVTPSQVQLPVIRPKESSIIQTDDSLVTVTSRLSNTVKEQEGFGRVSSAAQSRSPHQTPVIDLILDGEYTAPIQKVHIIIVSFSHKQH